MRFILTFGCFVVFFCSCSKTTFYIVRHAEKAAAATNMSSDVPLTSVGEQRAHQLKDILVSKNIGYIFSTSTIRTTSTAKPISEVRHIPVQLYHYRDTIDLFIERLRSIKGKNVLIVGHSNTVDDLVNKLMNKNLLTDLPDAAYDNLFIILRRGQKYFFSTRKY